MLEKNKVLINTKNQAFISESLIFSETGHFILDYHRFDLTG